MVLMSVSSDEAGDFRSKPRWSANRKIDVVLRLLRGESLEEVSREVGVEAHRLQAWRDDFLESGKAGLKQRRPRAEGDRRLSEAERKIGELTMENEILRRAHHQTRKDRRRRQRRDLCGGAVVATSPEVILRIWAVCS